MEPEYEIITREIDAKGKGYLILRRCPPGQLEEAVRRGARVLLEAGASLLYAVSKDPAAPLTDGTWEHFSLSFSHDMLRLERPLSSCPPAGPGLTLEPLCREKGGQWLALYNECFFDVPNSATYDRTSLERCLEAGSRCGFALAEGVPVGVYELDCRGETPEIAGIALIKDARGRGLGRALLRTCMAELAGSGAPSCTLLVSTANTPALALYRSEGFAQTDVAGRWYQILARGDLLA